MSRRAKWLVMTVVQPDKNTVDYTFESPEAVELATALKMAVVAATSWKVMQKEEKRRKQAPSHVHPSIKAEAAEAAAGSEEGSGGEGDEAAAAAEPAEEEGVPPEPEAQPSTELQSTTGTGAAEFDSYDFGEFGSVTEDV